MSRTPLISSRCRVVGGILAGALLALGGPVAAQPSPGAAPASAGMSTAPGKSALDGADRHFIEEAAMGGMTEVALGKLAQSQGSDAQVKSFGERMVQDHGKANGELMKLAGAKGVAVPAAIDRTHQRDVDKFAKLSGAEFDRAYMKHMVDDHKKDVAAFEKASKSARDADVKDFAARTLPTLQSHLQMAQSAHDAVQNKR